MAATAPDHALKLSSLINQGEPCRFLTPVAGGALVIEGRPSGGMAWLRITLALDATPGGKFAFLADRLPDPAWIADSRGLVLWANRAFIEAAEVSGVDEARAREAAFDRGAQAIVIEAGKERARREGFRWVTVRGERRAYRIFAEPVNGDEIAAFAMDITESEENREEALRRHVAAHDETLNHLADAVAIFGASRKLSFYNTAFQQLWDLEAAWLDERPTHGELLDRLRQRRRLPETTDYSKWKQKELDFYGSTEVAQPDDMWSLPDGRTLRVVRPTASAGQDPDPVRRHHRRVKAARAIQRPDPGAARHAGQAERRGGGVRLERSPAPAPARRSSDCGASAPRNCRTPAGSKASPASAVRWCASRRCGRS